MTKSGGSEVTVLMDANFKVTSVAPFGPGAGGPHCAPDGMHGHDRAERHARARRAERHAGAPNGAQPPAGAQAPSA